MKNRSKILRLGLIFAVGIIAVRLFFVQIIQHDEWVAKAEAQHMMENKIVAKRGEIYMMDGDEKVVVAMNETVYTVIVDPMVADREEVEEAVEKYIKEETRDVDFQEVFKDKTRRYYVLAKNISRETAEKIRDEKVYGITFQENTKRFYPEGELASGLLGFVNLDGVGQYGVEGAFNEKLSGVDGLLKTVSDVNNVALSIGDDNIKIPAKDGEDVVLTVDRNIQYAAEKALANGMKRSKATHASAIVMNPNNGEILAVANLPNYNPAEYWKVDGVENYINYAFEDPSEPASVCKNFTFAAGIDQGVITPDTTYYNAGYTTVDGWKIDNAYKKKIGVITMQDAMSYSLNTGSIQTLRLLGGSETEITQKGREILYEYYHDRFGLGEETGVEMNEAVGLIGDPNIGDGRNSMYANMTFGQNIQLTMIQVATAFSSLINGGEYYKPTIIKGGAGEPIRRTVSEATSATLREMLIRARGIYRYAGDRAGVQVGGKTGTAQVIENGKYILEETEATYIGFGQEAGGMPAYVIMLRIWGDGLALDGGDDAMPIFTELSNYMIDYLKLKPTK